MSDGTSLVGGVLIGLLGLGLLVHLDVPVIRDGGLHAVLATLELLGAVSFLSVAFALRGRELH